MRKLLLILKNNKYYWIAIILTLSLSACGGASSSPGNQSGGGGNVDRANLILTAPYEYPANSVATTAYLTIANSSTVSAKNLEFAITNNTTGANNITVV